MSTYIVTEGGESVLLYYAEVGLIADRYYLDALTIKTTIPYLTEEDKIIIILKGFTDFSISETRELIKSLLETNKIKRNNILVLSSMKLPFYITLPYFVYTDDLLYSTLYRYMENEVEQISKASKINKDSDEILNVVLKPYITYGVNIETILERVTYAQKKEEKNQPSMFIRKDYSDSIVLVDYYKTAKERNINNEQRTI